MFQISAESSILLDNKTNKTGIIRDKTFLLHTSRGPHTENPERLIAINQMLESEKSLNNIINLSPRHASLEELEFIHTQNYIKEIEETELNEYSQLDGDTYACRDTFKSSILAAGSVIECVEKTYRGEINSAFAFVRPPGHHAEKDRAMGFCIFNNVAIAARYALKKLGCTKVAIVDFDLHHGNGTQNSFYNSNEVLYISSHQFPHYPGTGSMEELGVEKGLGYTVNIPLPVGFGDTEFTQIYWKIINPLLIEFNPDMILVSAGFDIYLSDPLGGMDVTGEGFYNITKALNNAAKKTCNGNIVFVLEGGYSPIGLKDGAFNVLRALTETSNCVNPIDDNIPGPSRSFIEKIKGNIRSYWNL